MAKMKQTDSINPNQFEEEIDDEYSEEIIDDSEDEESGETKEKMGKALSSFKLSSGAIIITVIVLALIIVALVFFKPFSGGDGFSIGKFFGRDGSLASDVLGGDSGDNSTLSYEESLIQYLEGYTVEDNEDGTYTVEGEMDGEPHIMIYDGNFNILEETKGEEVIKYEIDEESGESVPTTALTEDDINIPEQSAEIVEGDDMVMVDRWNYEHSQLGMPETDLNVEYDDRGVAITKKYKEKYIVEFTKLPLRGHTPQVHVKIMDTDIELIFNVSADIYLSLEESGASMISADVTEVGGELLFNNIEFTKWK